MVIGDPVLIKVLNCYAAITKRATHLMMSDGDRPGSVSMTVGLQSSRVGSDDKVATARA